MTSGAMITLLTRATDLHPDLPLFDQDFAAQHAQIAKEEGQVPQNGRQAETAHLGAKVGAMKNWKYADGANYLFPPEEVKAVRKA